MWCNYFFDNILLYSFGDGQSFSYVIAKRITKEIRHAKLKSENTLPVLIDFFVNDSGVEFFDALWIVIQKV